MTDDADFHMSDFRAVADQQPEDSADEHPQKSRTFVPSAVEHDERVEAQQAELRGVQQMNSVIEGVVSSLEKANKNMEVSHTINALRITNANSRYFRLLLLPSIMQTSS
jgi:hypothetical protein